MAALQRFALICIVGLTSREYAKVRRESKLRVDLEALRTLNVLGRRTERLQINQYIKPNSFMYIITRQTCIMRKETSSAQTLQMRFFYTKHEPDDTPLFLNLKNFEASVFLEEMYIVYI